MVIDKQRIRPDRIIGFIQKKAAGKHNMQMHRCPEKLPVAFKSFTYKRLFNPRALHKFDTPVKAAHCRQPVILSGA